RPGRVTLNAPADFTIIGRDRPRLDAAEKARGAPLFGLDVRVDGMKYAAVVMAPTFGAIPSQVDTASAPGVHAVFTLEPTGFGDPAAVVAVADTWWHAREALRTRTITWSESPHAGLSSEAILADLREAAREPSGLPFRSVGDTEELLAQATRVIEATYVAPYLAHATMEPMNATVRVTDGTAECWVGTQVPAFARKAVAQVLDLDEARVTIHQRALGGGFGRRLDVDFIAQAAAIANRVPGVAVQLLWSREDDLRHDVERPAAVGHLRAVLGDAAQPIRAIASHSASQAPFKSYSRRVGFALAASGPDGTTSQGVWDQP
ncbi:MAG: xanthine dehydrogenase family protein molybdopterin-binding subunit, partial [Gemmatimonadota bacterium]